jgi:hypothetical protein
MDTLQDFDNIITGICVFVIIVGINQLRKDRLRSSQWVRLWIAREELSQEDPHSYKNFVIMDKAVFSELLDLVTPLI